MRKRSWFYLLLFLLPLFHSCQESVISQGKMVDVMTDLYLSDAIISSDYGGDIEQRRKESLLNILSKYDVTLQQYDSSLVWYAAHTDEYLKVHERVMERLTDVQKEVEVELQKNQAYQISEKGDSISLFKGAKQILLYPYLGQRFWSTVINKDKNFEPNNHYRLSYDAELLMDTSKTVVSLTTFDQNGLSNSVTDTLSRRMKSRSLDLYADSLFSRVEVKVEVLNPKTRAFRIVLSNVDLYRVRCDSIPTVAKKDSSRVDSTRVDLSGLNKQTR